MGNSDLRRAAAAKSKRMTVQQLMEQLNEEERAWETSEVSASEEAEAEAPQLQRPATDVASPSASRRRVIVVVHQLPFHATSDPDIPGLCKFVPEEDCPLLHLGEGVPAGTELVLVGTLPGAADLSQELRDRLARGRHLLGFLILAVFLPPNTDSRLSRLCKVYLHHALHSVIPYGVGAPIYDESSSAAWDEATAIFANAVDDAIRTHDDLVWLHDYHLFLLPSLIRHRHPGIRLGFSLYAPFPSRDVFLSLPPATQILNSLLCCDLLGFHALDHARHFLSCCRRALGLHHRPRRSPSSHGFLGVDHLGRTIGIHVLAPGIHLPSTVAHVAAFSSPEGTDTLADLRRKYRDMTVLLSIDEPDVFRSIHLKLLAFNMVLRKLQGTRFQGRVALIQMLNCRGRPYARENSALRQNLKAHCDTINRVFGSEHFKPVEVVEQDVIRPRAKAAFYVIADCLLDTAIRGGVNLIPYEYVVSRQVDRSRHSSWKKSRVVLSEFTGSLQALSRATKVNPLDPPKTAEALVEVISMSEEEKQEQHEKHCADIRNYDVAYWSRSFIDDLRSRELAHFNNGDAVSEDGFTELQEQTVTSAYTKASRRAIFLDYDGTLESESSDAKARKAWVTDVLSSLCADPRNVVFIVSGRTKKDLGRWFGKCWGLGIAAERGYFSRWGGQTEWESMEEAVNLDWVGVAGPLMKRYMEATKHPTLEIKHSAIVWRYEEVDPARAKEMVDLMKDLLLHEPVAIKSGHRSIEVHPQGINKGSVVRKVLSAMADDQNRADFVLFIGDDSSDQDMFEFFATDKHKDVVAPRATVITCTVANKASKAKYYLENIDGVKSLLVSLAERARSLSRSKLLTIFPCFASFRPPFPGFLLPPFPGLVEAAIPAACALLATGGLTSEIRLKQVLHNRLEVHSSTIRTMCISPPTHCSAFPQTPEAT
ncbi:unnamed protein product [Musa acuminata var. zebrina]